MNLFLFFESGRYVTFKLTSEYSYHVFDTSVMVDSICGVFYFPLHTIKYILMLTDLQLKDRDNVKWCLDKLNGKSYYNTNDTDSPFIEFTVKG